MLSVLSLQVVLRYIFKASNAWSDELARYLFIWFIFIGASYAAKNVAHIRIESINNIYPIKMRKIIYKIGVVAWIVFNIAVTYIGFKFTINIFNSNQMSLGLGVRMGYFYLAIPIGYAMMTIRIIQKQIVEEIKNSNEEKVK